jgi:phospholipid/cholesterol/gamma-HCH transport system substrate-binding protein
MKNAVRIGAVVLVALLITVYLILRIESITIGRKPGTRYVVELSDGQGLAQRSPVLLRGVRVGRVVALGLEGEIVESQILIEANVQLREGTRAQVSSVGLLGEKQLTLTPGPADAPFLPPGARIPGDISPSLDDVLNRIGEIGADVQAVTAAVRESLAGPQGRVWVLVDDLSAVAKTIDRIATANEGALTETLVELRRSARALAETSRGLSQLLVPPEGVGGSEGAPSSGPKLLEAIEHLESIAEKLDTGQGTLGKLINSDATAEKLNGALESTTSLTSALAHTEVGLTLRGEYLRRPRAPRALVGLELRPPAPAFLRLEAISVPPHPGTPDGFARPTVFSVQAGWRLRALSLRGGLIESRAGLGADLRFWARRFRLTTEVWDVSREGLLPHVRMEGAVSPLPWFSIISGADEGLNPGRRSFFVGGAIELAPAPEGDARRRD